MKIKFRSKGNLHYITYNGFTAIFDSLKDAWRFAFKLRKGLTNNGWC